MAYIAYSGLQTPNEVLEKMRDYIVARGYTLVQDLTDDLNIFDMSYADGKRFVFRDRTGVYFIILRSANGGMIFGTNDDPVMDITPPDTNINYTGIGMIVSEGYSKTQRWYNQYKVPKKHNGKDVYGVFMPMKLAHSWQSGIYYHVGDVVEDSGTYYSCITAHTSGVSIDLNAFTVVTDPDVIANNQPFTYTLYCNNVTTPTDSIIFSLVKEDDKYHQCTHLVYANVEKYDVWEGGALFSGSSIKQLMGDDVKVYEHNIMSDQYILPVLSSGKESNSFLRIDIDEAPTEIRGEIFWASSGTLNETGKKLSLPIRLGEEIYGAWSSTVRYDVGDIVKEDGLYYQSKVNNNINHYVTDTNWWGLITVTLKPGGNGKIPNYYYLQSRSRLDWGRNINTLNCITIDMPMFVAVLVDPDVLENYAAAGNISGIYCVSTLNMQTAGVYERSYPRSNDLCQIFPHGKRRGKYGFDGISIQQKDFD